MTRLWPRTELDGLHFGQMFHLEANVCSRTNDIMLIDYGLFNSAITALV